MKYTHKLEKATLLALGTGTSIACVCILGVVMIRTTVPGLWSLGAIAAAYLVCRYLAGVFGHLVKTVPSGAGMFAFVARTWGPAAGMFVIAPYLILMIVLAAVEALVVGHLLQPWLLLPSAAAACLFLVLSWLICIAGVRLSFRVQSLATWLLVAGVIVSGAWMLIHAAGVAGLSDRLLTSPPSPARFASAVGQAVFLFMGFELLCTQIEASDVQKISWALKSTVLLLAGLYGFVLLALSAASPSSNSGTGIGALFPQVDLAGDATDRPVLAVAIPLCLLASVTSLNGAFMGLSRLIAVMGSQRVLPPMLATIHAPSLIPRRALTLLLAASLVGVVAIDHFGSYRAVIYAAAVSAATLYALALLIRDRPPFRAANAPRVLGTVIADKLLVALLVAVAFGVLLDAGESVAAVTILLGIAYGAGLLAALRIRHGARRELPLPRTAALGRSGTP